MRLALGDVVPIEPKIVEAKRIAANNLAAASEKFASDMEAWAGWFLVAVRSGYEQSVEAAMLEAGVKAWVPMCEKLTVIKPRRRGGRRPRKRRTSIVHEVTFPGYMAVWIVPTIQSWSAITGFEHVLGLVAAHPESLWSNIRTKLQEQLANSRQLFAETVGRYRGSRFTAAQALATEAQTYHGDQAFDLGLIDAVARPGEAFEAFLNEVN